MLGLGAYRTAFAKPKAKIGLQDETFGDTKTWLLPNPSGLNANHQLPDLVRLFSELRSAVNRNDHSHSIVLGGFEEMS